MSQVLKLIDGLVDRFDNSSKINNPDISTDGMDKKLRHNLMIYGYILAVEKIRTNEAITPMDIILLIKMYCPIYNPYCQILFDFNNTNKIYVKLEEIAPNLENIAGSELRLRLCISFRWHDEYLEFEQPKEDDQQDLEFDWKLIQGSNNGIDHSKWEIMIQKLNTLNIGINGFVKRYNHNNMTTAVAFDNIDHRVLDLMETEFNNCTLRATWSCDNIDQFEWTKACDLKPSEWFINKLNLPFIEQKINLHFGKHLICQHSAFFEMNCEYYATDDEYMSLDITIDSIVLTVKSTNDTLVNLVKILIVLLPWQDFKTVQEYVDKIQNVGLYIFTKHDSDWELSKEEYLKILHVTDEMSKYVDLTISRWIWMNVMRE